MAPIVNDDVESIFRRLHDPPISVKNRAFNLPVGERFIIWQMDGALPASASTRRPSSLSPLSNDLRNDWLPPNNIQVHQSTWGRNLVSSKIGLIGPNHYRSALWAPRIYVRLT